MGGRHIGSVRLIKAGDVLDNVLDAQVFSPLLGGQQHGFRLGDVEFASAQESVGVGQRVHRHRR